MTGPRFTFDPLFPDGSPRRFAGMHRPPLDEVDPVDAFQLYNYHRNHPLIVERYLEGGADRPLYHVEADERQPVRRAGLAPCTCSPPLPAHVRFENEHGEWCCHSVAAHCSICSEELR